MKSFKLCHFYKVQAFCDNVPTKTGMKLNLKLKSIIFLNNLRLSSIWQLCLLTMYFPS